LRSLLIQQLGSSSAPSLSTKKHINKLRSTYLICNVRTWSLLTSFFIPSCFTSSSPDRRPSFRTFPFYINNNSKLCIHHHLEDAYLESLDASSHQQNVLLGRRNQARKRQVHLFGRRGWSVIRRRDRRKVLGRRRIVSSSSSLGANQSSTTARFVWFAMEKRFKRE
jgi:hypothetical protein